MGGFRILAVVVVVAFLLSGCAPDKTDFNHDNYTGGEDDFGPGDVDWDLLDSVTGLRLDDLATDEPDVSLSDKVGSSYHKIRSILSLSKGVTPKLSAQSSPAGPPVTRPEPSDATGIFVDAVLGDNANPGTMAAPVATLQAGVNKARNQGKAVFVAGGEGRTYGPFWADGEIYCGYAPRFYERDLKIYPTVITGGSDRRWGVAIGLARSALIDGCIIHGGNASWEATLGVVAWGPLILRNNKIDGGSGYLRAHGVGHAKTCTGPLEMVSNVIEVYPQATTAAGGVVNGGCDATLINNTAVVRSSATYGRAFASWAPAVSSLLVNNIFDSSGANSNRGVNIIGGSKVRLINNLISVPGGWLNVEVFGWTALNDWQRMTDEASVNNCAGWSGYCDESSGNIAGADPGYTGEERRDWRLLESSPGINGGIDPSSYYASDYQHEDAAANYRPAGTGWDIGAHELTVAEIGVGYLFACAFLSNGSVKCWGRAYQSGLETSNSSPTYPSGLGEDVKKLAVSKYHSCALTEEGEIKCWGNGRYLGIDKNYPSQYVPVNPTGLDSGVIGIATGEWDSCSILTDNSVKCWGDDGYLMGGLNYYPTPILGLDSDPSDISVGTFFVCATFKSGKLMCWGDNRSGELGVGSSTTSSPNPLVVSGISNLVRSIFSQSHHSCGKLIDGRTECFGLGDAIGPTIDDFSGDNYFYPTANTGVKDYNSISSSFFNTCFLGNNDKVSCWGDNSYGSLGEDTWYENDLQYSKVQSNEKIKSISLNRYNTCVLLYNGEVKCMGANTSGQLGDGSPIPTDRYQPMEVQGLPGSAVDITAGENHTCAELSDGSMECWGDDRQGQLGYGVLPDQDGFPRQVTDLPSTASELGAGGDSGGHTCAVLADGSLRCWGDDSRCQAGCNSASGNQLTPAIVSPFSNGMSSVAAGYKHNCALTAAGGVKCWGDADCGQDGNSANFMDITVSPPVDVDGLSSGVEQLALGGNRSCALKSGDVYCWGDYWGVVACDCSYGDCQNVPKLITGVSSPAIKIASGPSKSCAVISGGSVECWTSFGIIASQVISSGIADISGGYDHFCALASTGGIKCWGSNSNGQLGDGTTTDSSTPVDVTGLGGTAIKVATGLNHTCALLDNGKVECWGYSAALGIGEPSHKPNPVTVIGLIP